MKRTMAFILSALLLFAAAVPAFAATDTEGLEKLILSVKERIGDTNSYTEFSSEENRSEDGSVVYSFNWTDLENGYKNKHVNVTGDGVITYYYDSEMDRYQEKPAIGGMSRSEAYEKAKALASAFNPSVQDEIQVIDEANNDSLYESGFSFTLKRVHNGIPVQNNGGRISVDAKAEKITNYSLNYSQNVNFESADNAISKDAAQKAFLEKIGLELAYMAKYEDRKVSVYPAYVLKNSDMKISALDGSAITLNTAYVYNGAMKEASADMVAGAGSRDNSLSATELQELSKVQNLLSKEEGLKIIQENEYLKIDETLKLDNFSTQRDYQNPDIYYSRYHFSSESKEEFRYASVTINAVTGEITGYNTNQYNESKAENAKISAESALEKANAAAKAFAGEKYEEYRLDENKTDNGYFTYTRFVNGIPFRDNRIAVRIDLETGDLASYDISYTTAEFPAITNVISVEQAGEKLFSQIDYSLVYAADRAADGKISFKLIYDLDDSVLLNAFDGQRIGYDSEPVAQPFTGYTDISGHYAENMINTLAAYGIRVQGDKFTPDAEITQGDFLKLLDSVFYNRSVVYLKANGAYDYDSLLRRGILSKDELNETAAVTRLDAAKFLIRAIGAEEYAKLKGIYACPFKDVADYEGYVCILYGMGVINGDGNGNFNPDVPMTYADAAVVIYNYLTR